MPASTKTSQKRPAPSQAGPKAKKAHIEKNGYITPADKGKKRSQPVTAPLKDDISGSSEEEGEDEPQEFQGEEDGDDELVEDESEEQITSAISRDPNGTFSRLCRLALIHILMT